MQGHGDKWELCAWRVRIHTSQLTVHMFWYVSKLW